MALAPIPTYAAFLARCAKPEAFSALAQATVEAHLADATDEAAAYYGDRATLPLTEVCGGFTKAVCALAALSVLSTRGMNQTSGADRTLSDAASKARAWLQGVADKTIQPHFVDSSAAVEDAGLVATSKQADAWTHSACSYPREVS